MAPYAPPSAHYTQLNVPDVDEDTIFDFIGKGGWRLYKLTKVLGVRYLWYDSNRKAIEVWGSHRALSNEPCKKMRKALDEWLQEKNVD
tara:strand:- start:306 stop:569 length:264 start_codon:yes stop_codon:yes gene_type:complete